MERTKRLILAVLEKFFKIRMIRFRPGKIKDVFGDGSRQRYQEKLINFDIPAKARVLDIGSGPAPFQGATVLCERYLGETVHRRGVVKRHGLPMVVADIHALPFGCKAFDFVYCAHVLEHVDNPIQACMEIMRVGRRGYLETPNFMKDVLFCQAGIMNHRWHTVAAGDALFFFEYTPRELEGIRSSSWYDMIWSRYYHPIHDAFIENQDVFNTMFLWSDKFNVQVVTAKGATYHS